MNKPPMNRGFMSGAYLIRLGTESDADAASLLHSSRITEGFLPTLGPRFLRRLYRRIVRDQGSFLIVAEQDGEIVAMVSCTENIGALYRTFILRDAAFAAVSALVPILRSLPRVLETLRYPSAESAVDPANGASGPLPDAEVLAVAVSKDSSGKGLGRSLMVEAIAEFTRRGVTNVKVVAGSDNEAALALYRSTGFLDATALEVHEGTHSLALVWSSS